MVAVIILNWNGLEDTRECCLSVRHLNGSSYKVIIVDNGSSDGSGHALALEFPEFTHLSSRSNLGFSGGNNRAIEFALLAGVKYVLLLNNDTVVAPDAVKHLVDAAEEDSRRGMIGAKIYFYYEPDVIWNAGGNLSRLTAAGSNRGEGEQDAGQFDAPGETDFVTGCCVLVRADVIGRIGGLKQEYGYYYEDVDWSMRAVEAGYKLWYEPRAKIWHKVNRSTSRNGSESLNYYAQRNRLLFARWNFPIGERTKILWRSARDAFELPAYHPEKSVFMTATLHGILGRGGVLKSLRPSLFVVALIYCQKLLIRVRKHLPNRSRKP